MCNNNEIIEDFEERYKSKKKRLEMISDFIEYFNCNPKDCHSFNCEECNKLSECYDHAEYYYDGMTTEKYLVNYAVESGLCNSEDEYWEMLCD